MPCLCWFQACNSSSSKKPLHLLSGGCFCVSSCHQLTFHLAEPSQRRASFLPCSIFLSERPFRILPLQTQNMLSSPHLAMLSSFCKTASETLHQINTTEVSPASLHLTVFHSFTQYISDSNMNTFVLFFIIQQNIPQLFFCFLCT